jgi:hypothetical protein
MTDLETNQKMNTLAADYIAANKEALVTVWQELALINVEAAHDATDLNLRDNLAELLDDLQETLRNIDFTTTARESSKEIFTIEWSKNHGISRSQEEGYNSYQVLQEYVILRHVVTDQLKAEGLNHYQTIEALNCIFEMASLTAVKSFTESIKQERRKVVASLIHDIRSPMAAAVFGLDIIEQQGDDPEILSSMLLMVQRSNQRALQMVTSLLDTFAADTRQGVLFEFEDADFARLCRDSLEDMCHVYGERLKFTLSPEKITGIFAADMLVRSLENLVSNAIKHGSYKTPVTVAVVAERDYVKLSVHNEGDPIPTDQISKLFNIFEKGDAVEQLTGKKGWGVGLTYLKLVAEAHGGEITVVSSQDEGTTFAMKLHKSFQSIGQKYFRSNHDEDSDRSA